jgi:hypothetical protein
MRRRPKFGSYIPGKELPKKSQGVERCQQFDDNTKICITGGKYGFSAWITTNDGQRLAPVSVGQNARTPGGAMKAAMQTARRIRSGRR